MNKIKNESYKLEMIFQKKKNIFLLKHKYFPKNIF